MQDGGLHQLLLELAEVKVPYESPVVFGVIPHKDQEGCRERNAIRDEPLDVENRHKEGAEFGFDPWGRQLEDGLGLFGVR